MSDKFLNKTGLEHFWGKVKSNLDLLVNASDVITNDDIDRMFVTKVIAPVVELNNEDAVRTYIEITNIQEGYEYYYTLNTGGNYVEIPDAPADPTKESTLYIEPIIIGKNGARSSFYIKVIAYVGSESSSITERKGIGVAISGGTGK